MQSVLNFAVRLSMKTILIVIAGMADTRDPISYKETPMVEANIPALDMLARRGEITSFPPIDTKYEPNHVNALMSILGYDLERGYPSVEELREYGLDNSSRITDFETLRPFIIPGFSGHGSCITTSAWVRGAAKCALLSSTDIYSPGSSDSEILETIARLTTQAIIDKEFVLVYVDTPLKASLKGNYDTKVKALELIDRHLITPVADFVWKSDLMIHLCITTDLVTPWHRNRPLELNVPAILYFNNHDHEGDPEDSFNEVNAVMWDHDFAGPSDLIKYLSGFNVADDEIAPNDLPV